MRAPRTATNPRSPPNTRPEPRPSRSAPLQRATTPGGLNYVRPLRRHWHGHQPHHRPAHHEPRLYRAIYGHDWPEILARTAAALSTQPATRPGPQPPAAPQGAPSRPSKR